MVEIEDWVNSSPIVELSQTDSGKEVILYTEEDRFFLTEHRIPFNSFKRIFGPVIREAETSDEITGKKFLKRFEKIAQEEGEEGEEPTKLGYEKVIRHWVDHGPLPMT